MRQRKHPGAGSRKWNCLFRKNLHFLLPAPCFAVSRRGVTLTEVLIFSAIAAVAFLAVAQLLNKPSLLRKMVTTTEQEQAAVKALDRLVNDIREADPASFSWDVAVDTASLVLVKPRFDMAARQYERAKPIVYFYEPFEPGRGALMKWEDEREVVILEPIEEPTLEEPLVLRDAQVRVITVQVRYRPPGGSPQRIVRRVAIQP